MLPACRAHRHCWPAPLLCSTGAAPTVNGASFVPAAPSSYRRDFSQTIPTHPPLDVSADLETPCSADLLAKHLLPCTVRDCFTPPHCRLRAPGRPARTCPCELATLCVSACVRLVRYAARGGRKAGHLTTTFPGGGRERTRRDLARVLSAPADLAPATCSFWTTSGPDQHATACAPSSGGRFPFGNSH